MNDLLRMFSRTKLAVTVTMLVSLTGCGTYVPSLNGSSAPGSDQLFVQSIVQSIRCEIKDAIQYIVQTDIRSPQGPNGARTYAWFDTWGAQATLALSTTERGEVSPGAAWISNPLTSLFQLGGSVDVSTQATRTDTLNFFFTVQEFLNAPVTDPACSAEHRATHVSGSFLIGSNLRFREFLVSHLLPVGTGTVEGISKNGITHEIKFEIVAGASLNPAWTFSRWLINPVGPLLAANRNRTHELSVTFGPADTAQQALVGAAAGQVLASQISSALNRRIGQGVIGR